MKTVSIIASLGLFILLTSHTATLVINKEGSNENKIFLKVIQADMACGAAIGIYQVVDHKSNLIAPLEAEDVADDNKSRQSNARTLQLVFAAINLRQYYIDVCEVRPHGDCGTETYYTLTRK